MKLKINIHAKYSNYSKDIQYQPSEAAIDMSDAWGVIVHTMEISFPETSRADIINGTVKILKAEKDHILGAAQSAATDIDRRINEMLAIEYKQEAAP